MPIDVWGCHLGGVIPVLRRAANRSKWTDEQQRKVTPQLRYGSGKRREFPSHQRLEQSPEDHPPV